MTSPRNSVCSPHGEQRRWCCSMWAAMQRGPGRCNIYNGGCLVDVSSSLRKKIRKAICYLIEWVKSSIFNYRIEAEQNAMFWLFSIRILHYFIHNIFHLWTMNCGISKNTFSCIWMVHARKNKWYLSIDILGQTIQKVFFKHEKTTMLGTSSRQNTLKASQ